MKKNSQNKIIEVVFVVCIAALFLIFYNYFVGKEKVPNPYVAKEQKLRIPKEDLERENKMFDFLKQVKEPIKDDMENKEEKDKGLALPKEGFNLDKSDVIGNKKNPK